MIRQDSTDEYVRNVVAEMIRDPWVVAAMQHHDDEQLSADRERRVALERRLANFLDDYGKGLVTGQQLRVVTDKVTAELEEIEERMAVALYRLKAMVRSLTHESARHKRRDLVGVDTVPAIKLPTPACGYNPAPW